MQDLDEAKRQAARWKKDILILFNASDSDLDCKKLTRQVLQSEDFYKGTVHSFVLVHLDFPKKSDAKARVQDGERNERLRKEFQVVTFPTVILTDAAGRPYIGDAGYEETTPYGYLTYLSNMRQHRTLRDHLLLAVGRGQGKARLEIALKALEFLETHNLLHYYRSDLQEWLELARTHDPGGQGGYLGKLFMADWKVHLHQAGENSRELASCADRLNEWLKQQLPMVPDDFARLFIRVGLKLSLAGNSERAALCFKGGLACQPEDQKLKAFLTAAAAGKAAFGSGTGFIVADGGFVLTNHHVADGPGRLVVQLGNDEPIPAEIVAKDEERDMALLRIQVPARRKLLPLPLASAKKIVRGENVMVLGYPMQDLLGAGLKQTRGIVSGLPEPDTNHMILLDARINPGNSGGPLCDSNGNVIGMITAKTKVGSLGEKSVDSYGLALPARDLVAFLRQYLKTYKSPPEIKKMGWEKVDEHVSPSVVAVLRLL